MARRYAGPRRGFASAGTRRQTEWISGTVNFTDFTASEGQTLLLFNQAALAPLVPFTIIRTVGLVTISFDQNFITNQSYTAAVGGTVVTERASATFRRPYLDAGDDNWFYHQFFAGEIDDRTDSDILLSKSWPIDNKAQRKVEDGYAIQFAGEGGGESDGFDIALQVRILCKLH